MRLTSAVRFFQTLQIPSLKKKVMKHCFRDVWNKELWTLLKIICDYLIRLAKIKLTTDPYYQK